MSRLSALVLVVAWLGAGCSSTDPGETGAGGQGGAIAGTGGAAAGGAGGGSTCSLAPSDSRFGCAATYDAQTGRVFCSSAVETNRRATAGQCGAGWAWRCGSQLSFTCFYDGDKNLVRARLCEDSPTPLCAGCNCPMPNCLDSVDLSTDGAPTCDPSTLPWL
jgi:hypothetical protein